MKPRFLSSVLFAVALLAALPANAYDFMVDDIAYNITGDGTVEVINGGSYSGDIIIPSSVTYEGTTYSVTAIGKDAFYGCGDLTSVTIPNSVIAIGDNAFTGCDGLTTVTIPNSVTDIGDRAFAACSALTTVAIPNSVTDIGNFTFWGCSGLMSVTIPNSVTDIDDYAFSDCSGLTSIYAYPDPSKVAIGEDIFYNVEKSACVLHVPSDFLDAYKASPQWKDFEHIEPLP